MKHWLSATLLATAFSLAAVAQVLRPIDPAKNADDINNKSVTLPDVNLSTLPQPSRKLQQATESGKQFQYEQVHTKWVELGTLGHPNVETKALPQTNFTAKRAAGTDKAQRFKDVKLGKAPITDRQIKAFQPGGEEELKKQLNEPH